MGAIRRLYVYTVSAISLAVLAGGAYLLASLFVGQVIRLFDPARFFDSSTREDVSLAIALIIVATPIFAVHWWIAGRSVRADAAGGLEERRSAIRALHFALVQLVAWLFVLFSAVEVARVALGLLVDLTDVTARALDRPLAILLVAAPIWAYHARLRTRELRRTMLSGAQMWLTRLYRYAGAWISLAVALMGIAAATAAVLESLISSPLTRNDWWLGDLTGGAGAAIVGLLGWLTHWRDSHHAARDADAIGEDERQTRLRAVYFGGVIVVATAVGARHAYESLSALIAWPLGVAGWDAPDGFARVVIGPLLAGLLPFAAAGLLHARYQLHESRGFGEAAARTVERVTAHLIALVGLATLAGGAWRIIDKLLHAIVDRPAFVGSNLLLEDLPFGIALVVIGSLLWLPAWRRILRRRTEDQAVEQRSIVARAYLYLVLASSLIALIPAAAMMTFRLINVVMGIAGRSVGEELATPIAVLVVAAVVAAYHGWLLRRAVPTEAVAEPAVPPAGLPVVGRPVLLNLLVHAPAGTDTEAILTALRDALPAGATVAQQPANPTSDPSRPPADDPALPAAPPMTIS
jgi:hypothetical protein